MNEQETLQLVIDNLEAAISLLEGEMVFMKAQISRLRKLQQKKD